MKKSLLLLFAAIAMAVGAKAVTVDYTGMTTHNPFAYDVTATKTSTGVDVTYKLVGRPTAVSVELYKDGQLVKSVEGDITANVNTASIPMAGLATGTYKVGVKVTGSAVSAPTLVKNGAGTNFEYKFYAPWGVACNNSTESPTFGRIVTVESWYNASAISSAYMSGQGNGIGMGLYPFTPTFEPIKNSNNTYGFSAGMTAVAKAECDNSLDLKRVRYSDDGRLFVGRSNRVTSPIYEVNPNDFNANATPLFTGYQETSGDDGATAGKIFTDDTKATLVTGPCMGFDVVGSGADLKLIMVSQTINANGAVTTNAISGSGAYGYNLGTATTWNDAPSINTRTVNPSDAGYWINDNNDLAIGNGFFHIAQYRGAPSATQPAHVVYNISGQRVDLMTDFVSRGCGMAFNKDRARLAKGTAAKKLGIFTPGSDGKIGSAAYTISIDGTNVSGLAWDYADNLYVSTNSTEWVHCYAMPRSSLDVTTPARAEYDINWESSVPDVYILGTVNGNTWAPNVGVQMTYDATSSSYTATVSAGANGASFNMATALGADSNWDNFNGHNYRWGVQGGGDHNVTSAEYGTDLGAQMWDYSPGAWVVPEGEYNITWKFTGEYEATINIEKIEPVPDVYILGQVDGNAWAPNVGVQMTYDEATGLHSADVFVCKTSDTDNYGYFSFTTALGESWDAIAASRFGAVSEGDFLVDGHLGEEISLTASNGQSFKCLAGYYTITVDYKRMKAIINTKSFAPTFNPEPGTYYKVVNIAIASEEVPDADIYVTFHGETPTPESFHLTKELTLTESYTVKAIAVKYGVVSDVVTGVYTISNEPDPSQFEFVKVMETTQNIVAKADGRFSTGANGYVFVPDKANGVIYAYDNTGARSVFANASGIGTAISSDDAGNILVQKGFSSVAASQNWLIIEPNGDTHDLALTFPEGVNAARNDAAGRIVGNVMSSDGGYFCLMPIGNTLAAVFHIVNGAQVSADVVTPAAEITADGSTIAQPTKSEISLFAADPTAYWALRVRTNKHITRAVTRSSSDGFDIFELGGNTYTVEPIGTNYSDGYAIFKDGESEPVAVKAETIAPDGQRWQSLTARVSEDGSYATIYQNLSGSLVSTYTYGMPPTGVEKVGNDNSEATEVSAVYYNLQGQRVMNPAKGQVAIRVATLSDGSLRTKKVVIR